MRVLETDLKEKEKEISPVCKFENKAKKLAQPKQETKKQERRTKGKEEDKRKLVRRKQEVKS